MSLKQGVALAYSAYSEDDEGTGNLEEILRAWTRLEERENEERDLVISKSVPGYLETLDQGGVKVFVPLNLCRVSPSRPQRESIHTEAAFFRLQSLRDYCLSGSATFLGATSAIDDIDLAEYVDIDVSQVSGRLRVMAGSVVASGVTFDQLTVHVNGPDGGLKVQSHFPDLGKCLAALDPTSWRKLRIDGRAHFSLAVLGDKEVSNTAFPARLGQYSAESSVYQEIVFVDSGCANAPRSLADRAQITGYLDFLELDARKWKEELHETGETKPALKSLKRTLSLLLMLGNAAMFREGLRLLPPDLKSGHHVDGLVIDRFVDDALAFFLECKERAGASRRLRKGEV